MSKEIKRYKRIVKRIRAHQRRINTFTDQELTALTQEFRQRWEDGESLDRILPEAFAAMCVANQRILGLKAYDVQLMGGISLHEGCLIEMGTGEGKTLVATFPLYLNALTGKGAILVTTNEYLATRDYQEMGPVFRFMGLSVSVGVNTKQEDTLTNDEKREIYKADVVYTTHGAVGFDYLFDNLVTSASERFMRPLHYVIIDEADSVLLDAAQTPLVISGAPRVQSNLYALADTFVTILQPDEEFQKEEDKVWLTSQGIRRAEEFFQIENFYDDQYFEINRHVNLALRAHALFEKGKDYTISNGGELTLLDAGTGRIMPGVKLRGGQHQALEVKEGLKDSMETRSVASITYQNLFLLFEKMSGMSGTILENKEELISVYGTNVVAIPPHRPVIRKDLPDVYHATEEEKFQAAISAALRIHQEKRPVLIVASTIAETEWVSKVLITHNIPHNVLNANNAYWEASIIAEAGQLQAVTVATAMAGRGTDIKLDDHVRDLGGLAVIGIGRMANTRLERQVRGRAGRQGDPGSSQFFVALTDEVVKRNQIDQVHRSEMRKRPYGKRKLRKIIRRAQILEEEYAAFARKTAMDYDRVISKQRVLMYALRNQLLDGGTVKFPVFFRIAQENIRQFVREQKTINRQILNRYILDHISFHVSVEEDQVDYTRKREVEEYLFRRVRKSLEEQERRIGNRRGMESFMRLAALSVIDEAWVEEVDYLQQLQAAVSGRSAAQRNILNEFQTDAYDSFKKMETQIKRNLMRSILLSSVYMAEDSKLRIVFR